jgi:hypothetical protein
MMHSVGHLVESLWYKLEGRGFGSLLGHWIFLIFAILPAALCRCGLLSFQPK